MSKKNFWIITAAVITGTAGLLAGTFIGWHDEPEKAPPFLPGIYTCISLNEFCRIDDTLTIRRIRMGLVSFDGSDTMLYFPATNHLNKGYCFYEKIE